MVYDDAFRTVHSGDNVPTNSWSDLLIFKIFKSDYYESYFVPGLTDYWLTPIEANRRQEAVADHRGLAISDMVTNGDERRSQKAPSTEEDNNALDMSSQRAPSTVSSTVDLSQQRAPNVTTTEEFYYAFESEPSMVDQPTHKTTLVQRHPSCNRHPLAGYHQHG